MRVRQLSLNLINVFVGLVEGFLGFRFLLRLFGANDTNSFVKWVYDMSSVLLDPFRGIFPTKVFENRFVLEFSTLFAMLVYAVLALLVLGVIDTVTAAPKVKK